MHIPSHSPMILAAFLHQSHHPLLFWLFSFITQPFRPAFLYLAQMSGKARELVRFSKSQTTIHLWRWTGPLKTNKKSPGVFLNCRFLEMRHIQMSVPGPTLIPGMADGASLCRRWNPYSMCQSTLDHGHVTWYLESPSLDQFSSGTESMQRFTNAAFLFTALHGCTWWIFGDAQHPNATTPAIDQSQGENMGRHTRRVHSQQLRQTKLQV